MLARTVDRDGIRISEQAGVRRGVWLLIAAAALVALALIAIVRPLLTPPAVEAPAAVAVRPAAAARAGGPHPLLVPRELPPPAVDPSAAESDPLAAVDRSQPQNVEAALRAAMEEAAAEAAARAAEGGEGEPAGIELFPPHGTNPPKSGIVVPDDFELPPGYLRHNQTTDDGQALRPILMFHPDFVMLDETGAEIELPEDRVVTPDLAPPGLPIEMLEVPKSDVPMVELPEER